MNQANLIGRCASDPIIYTTNTTQRKVVRSAVAVDSRVARSNGQKTTSFFEIEAWDDIAQRIYDNVKKGDQIAITGHLEQKKFELKDGSMREKVVIVVSSVEYLSPKKREEVNVEELPDNALDPMDEDLPF